MPRSDHSYQPTGHDAITVDNTVGGVGLTAAKLAAAMLTRVYLTLETAQIRYTVDGTAPTTAVGHLLEAGTGLTLDENLEIKNFKAIRTGGVSGTLMCTYYK